MHPQPEDTGQAVREPRGEERADEAQQRVEDGDGLGDDHGEGPDAHDDADPGDGRDLGAADHVLGVAEHAREDVLGGDVAVDDAGDDDGRDGDAPDGLAHGLGAGGGEGGRGHVRADEDVDDDGGEEVQGRVGDLEEGEGLGPVLGLLELANDGEEAGVGSCDMVC